jgi:hypothetical protein
MTAPPVPNVEQVLATAWSLKPVPGEVTFYEADGGVAVMAGVWNSNHRDKLAVAWGCTPDGVDKVAEKVNAVLAQQGGSDGR